MDEDEELGSVSKKMKNFLQCNAICPFADTKLDRNNLGTGHYLYPGLGLKRSYFDQP